MLSIVSSHRRGRNQQQDQAYNPAGLEMEKQHPNGLPSTGAYVSVSSRLDLLALIKLGIRRTRNSLQLLHAIHQVTGIRLPCVGLFGGMSTICWKFERFTIRMLLGNCQTNGYGIRRSTQLKDSYCLMLASDLTGHSWNSSRIPTS